MSRSTAASGERVFTRNFLYIFFATFAFFAGFIFFFPVLPIFIDALGGTPTLIGALLGGSSIISICLRPFSGRLVDEQGRKRYITLGAVLLTASSFSYGLVSDTVLLWPARLAGGAGISLFFTASLAYAGDITPASKRGQMMGYWGMANNLAVALGPLLGVAILKANFLHGFEQELRRWYPGSGSDVGGADLNFATAFLTAGVIGLVCIVLTRRITEVYTPVKQPKVSVLGRIKEAINRKVLLPAWLNLLMVLNFVALNIFVPVYAEELGVANVGLSYYTVFAVFIILSRLFAARPVPTGLFDRAGIRPDVRRHHAHRARADAVDAPHRRGDGRPRIGIRATRPSGAAPRQGRRRAPGLGLGHVRPRRRLWPLRRRLHHGAHPRAGRLPGHVPHCRHGGAHGGGDSGDRVVARGAGGDSAGLSEDERG